MVGYVFPVSVRGINDIKGGIWVEESVINERGTLVGLECVGVIYVDHLIATGLKLVDDVSLSRPYWIVFPNVEVTKYQGVLGDSWGYTIEPSLGVFSMGSVNEKKVNRVES